MIPRPRLAAAGFLMVCASVTACGKKGPPLPPLYIVPQPVSDVSARRADGELRLRFVLPSKNANAPDPVNLGRVEIFAATVAAGAQVPPNRELLTSKFLVGAVEVKPPATEKTPEIPDDRRHSPGEPVTFVEQLTEAVLRPQFTEPAAAVVPAVPSTVAAKPSGPVRLYVVRPLARNGRPGQPSARIELPLVPPPAPPTDLAAAFTAQGIQLSWTAPATPAAVAEPVTFNVYAKDADVALNEKPLTAATFERSGVEFGKAECFVVRSALQFGNVMIESAPSPERCVTPTDTFAPAAPKSLSAVASGGGINLIWDAVPDADLAGYLVLRGEAPGETLQPVTPSAIRETTFRDTTVKPGVRYVYAIVAVDTATPPNTSAQSPRVEAAAR